MRRGERLVIAAEHLDRSGCGVARYKHYSVLTPNLLPGESAEVVVDHISPHRPQAWARVTDRVGEPSADRVEPACPQFGQCGGCVWQHLAYEAQLALKQRKVVEALASTLEPTPEAAPIIAAPAALHYRNKGKYVVGDTPDGGLRLGAYSPRSHVLVDTIGCRVVELLIDCTAAAARDALAESGLTVYSERAHTGELRYVIVRAGSEGRALIAVVTTRRTPAEPLHAVADRLVARDDVAGVVWVRNDLTSGALLTDYIEPLAGDATVVATMSGVPVRVGAGEFLQVNTAQAARMYATVADMVGANGDTRAVDLYCGVGGISFALASRGAHVVGVEQNARSVQAGSAAANRTGIAGQVQFHAGDAGAVADLAGDSHFDVAVINPPRKGLTDEARAAITALGARTLAYVSCGPKTLARDLADFCRAGYTIEAVQPFDLMPGTPQVETLVVARLY